MRLWFVCFVALFGIAELFPWLQGVALPLPLMLGAGVLLALVSNNDFTSPKNTLPQPDPAAKPAVPAAQPASDRPSSSTKSPQLPDFKSPQVKQRSISFTIRKNGHG
jgi:hypothetical protein